MKWTPTQQLDLLKMKSSNELAPPQQARALKLLRQLLKEAMSATIAARSESADNREAGDDQ